MIGEGRTERLVVLLVTGFLYLMFCFWASRVDRDVPN